MKFIQIFLIVIVMTACSAVKSHFDNVDLLCRCNANASKAKTPEGFVVSLSEIKEITPFTKYCWNIYADNNSYYLSSGIQKFSSSSGDNSYLAKKNGIKISGTSRKDIDKINVYLSAKERPFSSPIELREILDQ